MTLTARFGFLKLLGGATFLLLALSLASCAKPEPVAAPGAAEIGAGQSGSVSQPDTAAAVPVSATERPWYAERFEKLGFYVFPEPVEVGDFSVEALKGGAARLDDMKGKIVLLNFWATWCPPCRLEMPSIEVLWKKANTLPFTVMAVSVGEEKSTVDEFITQQKYSFPIYLDPSGALGSAFNARSIPTTYVVNKEGKVIAGIVGSHMYDGPEVLALFSELAKR